MRGRCVAFCICVAAVARVTAQGKGGVAGKDFEADPLVQKLYDETLGHMEKQKCVKATHIPAPLSPATGVSETVGEVKFEVNYLCLDKLDRRLLDILVDTLGVSRAMVSDEAVWKECDRRVEGGHIAMYDDVINAFKQKTGAPDKDQLWNALRMKARTYMNVAEFVLRRKTQADADFTLPPPPSIDDIPPKITTAPDASTRQAVDGGAEGTVDAVKDDNCTNKILEDNTDGHLTPDYIEGPWYKYIPHNFNARTHRPGIIKAINLLREVAENVAEITHLTTVAREETLPVETRLLSEGRQAVANLQAELASVRTIAAAHAAISPTQAQISTLVSKEMVPELARLSSLSQTEADLRFPFAERVATFTEDLQKATRTRDEMCHRLEGYVSPDQLNATCRQYDIIKEKLKEKIDSEIATSNEVLNKNSADLSKSNNKISALDEELSGLRDKLDQYVQNGKGHIPGQEGVKRQALKDEQVMIEGVEMVGKAQAKLLQETKSIGAAQLEQLHLVTTLLVALGEDAQEDGPDASLPPLAHRTVQYPDDPLTIPIFGRANSPNVPMTPAIDAQATDKETKRTRDQLIAAMHGVDRETLMTQFNIFDTDNDGAIDAQELKEIVRALSLNAEPQILNEIIAEFDLDKNGKVSANEVFSRMQTIQSNGGV